MCDICLCIFRCFYLLFCWKLELSLLTRVKKKKCKAISLEVGNRLIEAEEFRERKPVDKGVKLLADTEFENESNGYGSESEEDEPKATSPMKAAPVEKKVSKKRKASKIIRNSKYVQCLYYL